MKTIPVLYGIERTKHWILIFTLLHFVGAVIFMQVVGSITSYGIIISILLLFVANIRIFRGNNTMVWLKVLPMFHGAMLVSVIAMIVSYFI